MNKTKALVERINADVEMLVNSESMTDCTSAYVRVMDYLANLYLSLMKKYVKAGKDHMSVLPKKDC